MKVVTGSENSVNVEAVREPFSSHRLHGMQTPEGLGAAKRPR